jgi:predicted dehydrogenase
VEQDLRRVFDNREIDVVSIATPDHWHALATIWACQAGKDVYLEAPGAHNIWEGRRMLEAAHKYSRIVQHGVEARSSEALREGIDLLHKGVIGRVYMARGIIFRPRMSIGRKPVEDPPPHFDYNLWQGPAQVRPFSQNVAHYNWRWRWDYGGGDMAGEGVEQADLCLWGLGVGLPEKISSMGARLLYDDDRETPETQSATYLYSAQRKMIQLEARSWTTNDEAGATVGNIFYGSEGLMVVTDHSGFQIYLGPRREKGPARQGGGDHFANFLKAVRSRKAADQNGPVETAHLSSALAHLANISHRLERQLLFDPDKERFVRDEQANEMLSRKYRAPFVVPERI